MYLYIGCWRNVSVCTEPVTKVSTYIVLLSAHWYRTKYTPVSITCKPLFFQCHYCRFHLHRRCQLYLSLILQVGACLTACLPVCVGVVRVLYLCVCECVYVYADAFPSVLFIHSVAIQPFVFIPNGTIKCFIFNIQKICWICHVFYYTLAKHLCAPQINAAHILCTLSISASLPLVYISFVLSLLFLYLLFHSLILTHLKFVQVFAMLVCSA